jgi:uncharacterized protein YfkK (UPF0435 family)
MTESIQRKIQEIGGKMKILHTHLLEERSKNAQLIEDLSQLKSVILEKDQELIAKNQLISEKESQLDQINEQNAVSLPDDSLNRAHEIDELVKEIEYCIGQLRK